MKQETNSNLEPGTGITFTRGCLSYEGTITSRGDLHGITVYEVDVNAPGGGPVVESVSIHDGQIVRVFR